MNVLFLTHDETTPSTRYRVLRLLPHLRDEGIRCEQRALGGGLPGRWGAVRAARNFDAVVLQKRLLPSLWLSLLRRGSRTLVYDFDDLVGRGRERASRGRSRRFAAVVRAADLSIAGNAYLAGEARSHGGKSVSVLPTGLEPADYPLRRHGESAVIGWIGGGGNLGYLEAVFPALKIIARARPDVRLRVVSDRFPEAADVPVERRPWLAATEAADLAEMDVGWAPLPDDPWTRGKCGFRILQYMAAGLPVVASPVGVQAELVEEGRTGTLARTEEDWVERTLSLLSDPGRRAELGGEGRRKVERSFASAALAGELARLLRSASAAAGGGR